MRLTKEREAEIREAVKYEGYLRCEAAKALLAEIDYLRDSFLRYGSCYERFNRRTRSTQIKTRYSPNALTAYCILG